MAASDLSATVRERIDVLLCERGIYEVSNYGWIDADTADSDLIGHAMWQTRPLLWDTLGQTELKEISDWNKAISVAGADFEGLMIAARLSIGLSIYYDDDLYNERFSGGSFCELHLISATLMLSAVTDRLRQIFIASAFRKREREYGQGLYEARKRAWYSTPFYEFSRTALSPTVRTQAAMIVLPSIADKLHEFREERNSFVHEVATTAGRRELHLIENRRLDADHSEYEAMSLEEIKRGAQIAEVQHRARVESRINRPIEWYKLAIEGSNQVFIVEHELRDYR